MPGGPPGYNNRPVRGPGNSAARVEDYEAAFAARDQAEATAIVRRPRADADRGLGDHLARVEEQYDAGLLPRDPDRPHKLELVGPDGEVLEWGTPWAATFLDVFAKTATVSHAARAAGIHPSTVLAYRERSRRFNQAMASAVDEAIDIAQASLYQRGLRGDTPALKYWLENVGRHRFGRDATQGGKTGGTLEIVIKWPEGVDE